MFALACGKLRTAEVLFELGEKATSPCDEFGNTLLHYAMSGGAVDFVVKKTQTKLETRNVFGLTPLMHAFAVGSHDAILALLGYGADPTALILSNQGAAISLLEVREKSALLLPWSESDSRCNGCFRIPIPSGGAPATASASDKKLLTQGLARRSSVTLKKKASVNTALVIALGQAKF